MGEINTQANEGTIDHDAIFQRLLQAHGARIEKLIWIAASIESSELNDFLYDQVDEDTWDKLFPDVPRPLEEECFDRSNYRFALVEALGCYKKLGFLAEVYHPVHTIRVENGAAVSSSYSTGHNYVSTVYSETLMGLIEQIEISAEEQYQYDFKRALKKLES